MEKSLVIRVDANAQAGTGHFMRCLALAQAWKIQGGQAMFITACESDGLRQRLSDEGFRITGIGRSYPGTADWDLTSRFLAKDSVAWVVLDGYQFDAAYQRRVKEMGHLLLVIDDTAHLDHYYADMILNQNLHAKELRYSCEPHSRLLLGTRYVLMRPEFRAWRRWRREIPDVGRKVLVTLGGSDIENQTLRVIHVLECVDVKGLEVVVVVGASNPHYPELKAIIQNSQFAVRMVRDVKDMAELMAWADLAVSAGGSTCWELAFMGLPTVVMILAENQESIAKSLEKVGAAVNVGWYDNLSTDSLFKMVTRLLKGSDVRLHMSCCGRSFVDGLGTDRVVEFMQSDLPGNIRDPRHAHSFLG